MRKMFSTLFLPFRKREITLTIKSNNQIKADRVRLVLEDGTQYGFVSLDEARRVAVSRGFDLVEVAEDVCKLMDLGLMKFNESKKPKPKKDKSKQAQFNVGISDNDFQVKIRNIDTWLKAGMRVSIKVQLRGRLASRPELAEELSIKILDSVKEGQLVSPPKMSGGRDLLFQFAP